jgi:DNA polymerase-3 subunit gamma/tau
MAVSLFRRWRSQKFKDLVGQESVVSTLQNVLLGGSPARAYLFCGPRGTGKTSSARIFAKAINCERGPAAEPCGECHQCVSIAEGNNLDVFEIDAASHTQVDKIRDFIVEKVHFTPVSARHKVYIIDEVHKLSTSSFNALLKTLEEPPSHVVFILATTHPHEMPATILSRCQRYDFRPLTATETEKHLLMIAKAENLEVDIDAARQLARAADGSLRDALVLFEQAVVFSDGRVTRERVLDLLGGVGYEVLEEMLLDLIEGRTAGALRRLDDWISRGRDLKRLAESFQEHLRMMLLLKVKSEDQTIRHLSTEERQSLERLCAALTAGAITSWLRQIMELLAALRHGHAARLEWEMLLVSCAQPDVDPSLQGLERRLERLEAGGIPASALSSAGDSVAHDPRLLARLEALESAEKTSAPATDQRLLARVEALEANEGQGTDPLLWEKLTRLEAELHAWKDRLVAEPVAVHHDEPAALPEPASSLLAPAQLAAEVRAEAPEAAAPPAPTDAGGHGSTLLRDVVDDWLEMPPLLVNPEDFRRELPLFSTYTAAPDPEPETPEPELAAEVVELAVELRSDVAAEVAGGVVEDETLEAVVEIQQTEVVTVVAASLAPRPEPPAAPAVREPLPQPLEPAASLAPEPLAPGTPASPVPAAAKPVSPPTGFDIKDFWRSLMLTIREQDKRLHAVLTDARLTAVEEARFEIALPAGFEWHRDKLQEGRKLLESVAGELAGGRLLTLECTLGGEKATPPKDSEHDDLVARANGVFGGASIVE